MSIEQTERFRHINAMNMIVARAEGDIHLKTGIKVRLIVMPVGKIDTVDNPQGMLDLIAEALECLPSDYWITTRTAKYVHLRILGAYFLRIYYPGLTLKEIGKMIGGVDHTMVIYYLEKTKQHLDNAFQEFERKYDKALNAVTQWLASDN